MQHFKRIFFIFALLMSTSSFAKNIWRDCGIGALIFPSTGWAAVTSNIIWDAGLTGSSSTTTSEDQCAGKGASVAKFIYQNYAMVEEDTAQGNGQYVTSILDILSCKKSARAAIIESTREGFRSNLQNKNYLQQTQLQKAEGYYNVLMNNIQNNYASSCQTS